MKLSFRLILLFYLITASSAGIAQTVVSSVLLKKEQGLNDRTANLVVRDSIGFFYVSTDVGIMRYDGKEFVNLNVDNLFKNNVDPSSVKSLAVSPGGMIIIRTEASNMLFYVEPGGLIVKTIDIGLSMEWIVSNKKLFAVHPKNGAYDVYKAEWDKKIHLKNLFTSNVYPDHICRTGNTFIIESNRNIYIKNPIKPEFRIVKKGKILESETGIFLAADQSLDVFENGNFRQIHALQPLNSICTILKSDKFGRLIAAYASRNRFIDSIYILDRNMVMTNYSSLIDKVKIIKDIYTDDASHMWMLAGHHGIMVTGLLRDGATFSNRRPYLKDETFGSVISGIAADHKGNVLYAVENQDLIIMNTRSGRRKVLFQEENQGQGFINNGKVYFDKPSGTFYMFGYVFDSTSVIFHFNKELNSYFKYKCPFNINDFLVLTDGRILVAGQDLEKGNGILYCIEPKSGKQTVLMNYQSSINSVYYHPANEAYWVGSADGLMVLDKHFKQIHKFDPYQSPGKKYIKYKQINVVEPFHDHLMVGTFGGGAYFIDPIRYEVIYQLDHSKGLSDEKIAGVLTDSYGNGWLPTFNGITIIDSSYRILTTIYGQDGLPEKELNTKAYTMDENGNLYFGTVNGMVIFDPAKVLGWQKSHGFCLGESTVIYRSNKEVISLNAVSDDLVSLRFNYIKPDYIYNLFDNSLPLVNTNDQLHTTVNASSINIHSGSSGSYNMNVSFPGLKKIYKFPVVIRKDYTRYVIFVMILIVSVLLYRIYQLQRKNKKQKENAIRSKISILELEALQSQMNPHFLFNALGSIQYFIQTENIDKADDYLSDFAQLMRMILESSHNKFIPLSHEIKLLQLYISLEQIRFNNKFDFEFKIGKEVDPEFNIPPMLTQPFIENAINHGLNNLNGKKGYLEIKIDKVTPETLSFMISDNGIGRTQSALKSKNHKSRGTQIVKERVETLNETNYFNVHIDTTDLVEGDENSGTRVNILFHDMKIN